MASNQRIRIRLKAYDHEVVDQSTRKIVETVVRTQPKVGRNDPCPCGSGKKYKKCHGA